jgi:predicted RecB family nuclease
VPGHRVNRTRSVGTRVLAVRRWRNGTNPKLGGRGCANPADLADGAPSRFVPIRFVANNRLSASDKTMAAFEALTLAKALGTKTGTAKIVHGEKQATLSVNASALSRAVHKKVSQAATLISAASPPDRVLNRHCPECGFHDRCRSDAVEKDDLGLLSRLTGKERARYRGKGIFTVSQLAYTFRPRRRSKRLAARPEKYHQALKALAIRERKIHVVGKPELLMEGTPVFLDVEGLPDRDFYYLVGIRVEGAGGTKHRSLWADSPADEKRVCEEFLGILSDADRPTLRKTFNRNPVLAQDLLSKDAGIPAAYEKKCGIDLIVFAIVSVITISTFG